MVSPNSKLGKRIITKVELRSSDGEIIPKGSVGIIIDVIWAKQLANTMEFIVSFAIEDETLRDDCYIKENDVHIYEFC